MITFYFLRQKIDWQSSSKLAKIDNLAINPNPGYENHQLLIHTCTHARTHPQQQRYCPYAHHSTHDPYPLFTRGAISPQVANRWVENIYLSALCPQFTILNPSRLICVNSVRKCYYHYRAWTFLPTYEILMLPCNKSKSTQYLWLHLNVIRYIYIQLLPQVKKSFVQMNDFHVIDSTNTFSQVLIVHSYIKPTLKHVSACKHTQKKLI